MSLGATVLVYPRAQEPALFSGEAAPYVPICAAVSSVNWVSSVLVRAGLGEFRDVAEDVSEAGCEQGDVALVLQKS